MQRLMDGCATTGHMLAAGLSAYEELAGPNVPVTSGFQVRDDCVRPSRLWHFHESSHLCTAYWPRMPRSIVSAVHT